MLSHKTLSLVLSAALAVSAHPKCGGCAAANCFSKAPVEQSSLTSFCYNYLSTSAPATQTVTVTNTVSSTATDSITQTVDVTASPDPATVTETSTDVVSTDTTLGSICTVTSTVTTSLAGLPTFIYYKTVSPTQTLKIRDVSTTSTTTSAATSSTTSVSLPVPTELTHGCKPDSLDAKLSSACSCVLGSPTTATVTVTATATALTTETNTAIDTSVAATAPPATVTEVVTTFAVTSTAYTCSEESTTTVTTTEHGADFTCGIASPTAVTSGSITCTSPAPAGQTNARLRIEGGDDEGTIFEDCIASGAQDVTTPSGGTHRCDATNNRANPNPGGNMITNIAQAAIKNGFTYDGTFSQQFDDFFIQRIGSSTSTGNKYWGVLQNFQYTPAGGCETAVRTDQEGLWAFDAFNVNFFLKVEPEYQVVSAGMTSSVTVNVKDGMSGQVVRGATINGASTNSNGDATFAVPTVPGCYQYKATYPSSIRSNTFYLTVMPPLII